MARLFTYNLTPSEIVSTYNPDQIRGQVSRGLFNQLPAFGGGPMGGSNMGGAAIGMGLGYGLAGAMGAQPPEAARLQKIQGIGQGIIGQMGIGDMIEPGQQREFVGRFGTELMKQGFTDEAFKVMQMAGPQGATGEGKDKLLKQHRDRVFTVSKPMQIIDSAYEKIQRVSTEETATGDMSMIFGIMKLNDPNSTVREGEYATASNAGGVSDRLRNIYNMAIDGQKLTGRQRTQFLATADNLYKGQRASTDRAIENILQLADVDAIDRREVLGDPRLKAYKERKAEGKKPKPKPKVEEEYGDLTVDEIEELKALEAEFATP
ncbi:MAG: hypothetical protein KJN90_01295 [Gammaproteobacteria bacterium]|nr:hypothetical protein [Gammaproteobacteria bacterium]